MKIIYTPEFERKYKRLPELVQVKTEHKTEIFVKDPFDIRLRTHKLSGRLSGCWAFSVDFKYRIIFTFESDNLAVFHAIGGHEIYF